MEIKSFRIGLVTVPDTHLLLDFIAVDFQTQELKLAIIDNSGRYLKLSGNLKLQLKSYDAMDFSYIRSHFRKEIQDALDTYFVKSQTVPTAVNRK